MSDPTNDPPPPAPYIKVEMIEQDVMEKVGEFVDKEVVLQKRKTDAGNPVYRVNVTGRADVQALLAAILPYTVGKIRTEQIKDLLSICDEYDAWIARGGKSNQAARAARVGHAKRKAAKEAAQAAQAEQARLEAEGSLEDEST
jgi:hypothetical protein